MHCLAEYLCLLTYFDFLRDNELIYLMDRGCMHAYVPAVCAWNLFIDSYVWYFPTANIK